MKKSKIAEEWKNFDAHQSKFIEIQSKFVFSIGAVVAVHINIFQITALSLHNCQNHSW